MRVDVAHGIAVMRLTRSWAHDAGILPAGTEVRPISFGFNNISNREERTLVVLSGPDTGAIFVGPY